jgi:AraC family transcriptional regulator of arabinose operon
VHEQINHIFQSAELSIVEFDIQTRNEMKTYNRSLPFYVMSYHKKGEAKLRVGEEVHTITPGTVVIIPPHIQHDHYKETTEETIFLWCHFTYEVANVIDVLKLFNFPITFVLRDSERFEKVFKEFKEINEKKDFLSRTILTKAKSHEMLYLLLEGIVSEKEDIFQQNESEDFLCILNQFIKNPEKDFSLKDLSKQFHLHPTYISNRFKEIFGKSPIQVQRELKIDLAKKLLKSTKMSITEIAHSLGYPGIPGFTRLFKSYVGISPSQYRNIN